MQPTPPDPQLRASLDSSTSATVAWEGDRRLCLYYEGVFVECRPAGRNVVTFGKVGPLSGDLRPAAGGVYVVQDPITGASWRAPLRWWRWLAVWRA